MAETTVLQLDPIVVIVQGGQRYMGRKVTVTIKVESVNSRQFPDEHAVCRQAQQAASDIADALTGKGTEDSVRAAVITDRVDKLPIELLRELAKTPLMQAILDDRIRYVQHVMAIGQMPRRSVPCTPFPDEASKDPCDHAADCHGAGLCDRVPEGVALTGCPTGPKERLAPLDVDHIAHRAAMIGTPLGGLGMLVLEQVSERMRLQNLLDDCEQAKMEGCEVEPDIVASLRRQLAALTPPPGDPIPLAALDDAMARARKGGRIVMTKTDESGKLNELGFVLMLGSGPAGEVRLRDQLCHLADQGWALTKTEPPKVGPPTPG